ncbi:putative zinc finger CCCH domain-containing protein 19-like [Capsicum annuum]|nr:putative zinc finger CCCH domain-containing protein 19-like [Capsicum annuum]
MSREGDWMCAACQHLNFKKRDACQRCSCPKYATPVDVAMYGLKKKQMSWLETGYGYDSSALPGWKSGDWICSRIGCGMHNYASRAECYKCKTPRDFGEPSVI